MIDIHSHILPMVDDGAQSVNEALALLDKAYRRGTDAIVLTPHFAYEYGFINPNSKIKELFDELSYIVEREHIPIRLYLGCEFLFSDRESFLYFKDEITTINDTNYILMEFFFDVNGDDILDAIDTITEHHLIPVIAHPERYDCVQNSKSLIYEMVDKGALLQINKGSILGRYGRMAKETALHLLDNHYISFVGSDAHSIVKRTSSMRESYTYIKEHFGSTYAKKIFIDNPAAMLEGKDIRKQEDE